MVISGEQELSLSFDTQQNNSWSDCLMNILLGWAFEDTIIVRPNFVSMFHFERATRCDRNYWFLKWDGAAYVKVCEMVGMQWLDLVRTKRTDKKTVIVGLKSDTFSRDVLLRVLTQDVKSGDTVLAVHVEEENGQTFDPNTFHIHEDLCKSKHVDFQVKVCAGDSYVYELCHQTRVTYATILVLGCSSSGPDDSVISSCLKELPFSCTLLVMGIGGKTLIRKHGTSQQGSLRSPLQSYPSTSSKSSASLDQSGTPIQLKKSFTISSTLELCSVHRADNMEPIGIWKTIEVPGTLVDKLFQRLSFPGTEGLIRNFTSEELKHAANNFSPEMLIGLGGNSKVFRANLDDAMPAAVKVLKSTKHMEEDLSREVEILSNIKHDNIVQIIGYCYSGDMSAIVYKLQTGSLKQKLKQLIWSERVNVAIGVAKALEYLHHHCSPPIIHRDVKSSNILLSGNSQPRLSDFGLATRQNHPQQTSAKPKPFKVVGTFGYLAPEYVMYGMVSEKVDVYSYGVVLLELITGKEALQTNEENRESLVLWARPLLGSGTIESLIDPCLSNAYNVEEMEIMMIAARLCLIDSPSRRPTMKLILKLFEEPEND